MAVVIAKLKSFLWQCCTLIVLSSVLVTSAWSEARLSNISTRAQVGTGDEVLIGGFVVSGDVAKTVLIRALGPSLVASGVSGVLANPSIKLVGGAGPLDQNDNWQDHLRAFDIPAALQPSDPQEAAILATLAPGAYTAIIRGVGTTVGVALAEVYEIDTSGNSQLINISTRGLVGVGDDVMIGGLVITGDQPKTVAIRALGQTLSNSGVPGVLQDPTIKLFSTAGNIDENNDQLDYKFASYVPENLKTAINNESVIIRTLAPGAYTAIVRGTGGTRGVALIEVYDIELVDPEPTEMLGSVSVDALNDLVDDSVEVVVENQPNHGQLVLRDSHYHYEPDLGYDGSDSFSFLIRIDGAELRRTVTLAVLADTDSDGISDREDTDDDGDGVSDSLDAFPLNAQETLDTDGDGIGNNADPDDDNDTVLDLADRFPLDSAESLDTDNDGIGNNADDDDDGDGVIDALDAFLLDFNESLDTDKDGIGNNADTDDDNDGVADTDDALPLDETESVDTDNDGTGNNADGDDDNDTVLDGDDAFPLDNSESVDTDSDGTGNNADTDDDNDGLLDINDAFSLIDLGDLTDTDGDGAPDECDADCLALGLTVDPDVDGDGFAGAVDDCNDFDAGIFPGANEILDNNIDEDCDGKDGDNAIVLSVTINTPASLQTFGITPIPITGEVSSPLAEIIINGIAVPNQNGTFGSNVALQEGFNALSVRARLGNTEAVDSITAVLDQTPPIITIESHSDGQQVFSEKVTITGLVNDTVRGAINAENANVTVNGVAANVANRSYAAFDVLLTEGENAIDIIAADQSGNIDSKSITLIRQIPIGEQIEIVSGQGQSALINSKAALPLMVRVSDASNVALANTDVIFRVSQGTGTVNSSDQLEQRAVVVATDANGFAGVDFTLGARVGSANQKVTAAVVGVQSTVIFSASASADQAVKISLNAGDDQRGAVGQRLSQPFVVYVTDEGANPVVGARVNFAVTVGSGLFANGQSSVEAITTGDGFASADFWLGAEPGIDFQRVTATLLDHNSTLPLTTGFSATAFVPADPANTTLSGIVLDTQGNPLQNVTLSIDGTSSQTVSNSQGQFQLTQVPVGPVHLIIDGSTINNVVGEFPTLSANPVTVAGVDNPLPSPIYMVRLTETNVALAGNQDVVVTMEDFPGYKLEIAANSATFPDGSKTGIVSITAVNTNSVPMVPPNGLQPQLAVTIQPAGTLFDPPAKITLPNLDGLPAGRQVDMYSFDHDLEEFVSIGLGTVSDGGALLVANPGVGILKAGWFIVPQPQTPAGDGAVGGGPGADGDPGGGNGNQGGGQQPDQDQPVDPANPETNFDDDEECGLGSARPQCNSDSSSGDDPQKPDDQSTQQATDQQQSVEAESNQPIDNVAMDESAIRSDNNNVKEEELADPIVVGTGELNFAQTDLKIPSRGFDFELTRTYRSRSHFNGRLGYNWVFNYHQGLVYDNAGEHIRLAASVTDVDIIRDMPDGSQYTYKVNPDGSYTSPESLFDTLRRHPDGSYTVRKANGFKYNFDALGKLASQVDRFGNQMQFEYDNQNRLVRVIDTLGRVIVFSYRSDSGHIDTVTDFTGRAVRYYYDANRDLIAARTPIVSGTPNGNDFSSGKFTFFTYSSGFDNDDEQLKHANHNLLTVTDAFGHTYLINSYQNDPSSYEFDRVIRQQFGDADQVFQLDYQRLNTELTEFNVATAYSKTTMIDRNGNRHEYTLSRNGLTLAHEVFSNRNVNPNDPDSFITRHTYTTDGLTLSTTHPEGDVTTYRYDSSNPLRYQQQNLISQTFTPGPRGAQQTELQQGYLYEPVYNQVRSSTNKRGFVSSFIFDYQHADNLNALADELDLTPTQTTALLGAAGIDLSGGISGQITGNIVRSDSPTVTLPDGSTQTIYETQSYNRFGQIVESVDPEGIVTAFEYYPENDPDGDGITANSANSLASDTGGYLRAVVLDARSDIRRSRTAAVLAIRTESAYDPVGNEILTTDGRGNSTRYIYNQLNQVVRSIDSAPFEYLTDYFYDANNNLVRTSRQNVGTLSGAIELTGWVHTLYRYNALNDKTSEILIPELGVQLQTSYQYDANQNLVAITQPEGNSVRRIYDERDLVYQSIRGAGSAVASTLTMNYDGNGNLVQKIDAADTNQDGVADVTTMTYDGYDRLIQTQDAVANRMTYAYDANGNVVLERHFGRSGIAGIDNEILLAQTSMLFDAQDRDYQRNDSVLVNGQAQLLGTGLSPGNNLVTGVKLHDANGMVQSFVDDNGNQTRAVFDGLDRQVLSVDANGNRTANRYDNNSNLIQQSTTEVSIEGLIADKTITSTSAFDELNRRISTTDQLGNSHSYRYDSRNNVVQHNDALGNIKQLVFDGINRLRQVRQYLLNDGTRTGFVDLSNPTNPDGYISTTLGYDGNSRLVFQSDDKQNVTTYAFDALNRRTTTNYADGTSKTLVYDADDNVLSRQDQNGSIFSYQYDAINRLLRTDVQRADGIEGATQQTFSYDGLSRRITTTDNNDPALAGDDSEVQYRYNSLNHLLSETNNGLVTSANYDGLGNRQQLTYPGGRKLNYRFDAVYNLKAINDADASGNNIAGPAIVEYDFANNRVLARRYGNGTQLNYAQNGNDIGYDRINRVLQKNHTDSDNNLLSGYRYIYDAMHNQRYQIDSFSQLADVYEYDSAYRLIRAAYRVAANDTGLLNLANNTSTNSDVASIISPEDESYLLDGVGNWVSLQTVNGSQSNAVGYQANAMNEYDRIGAAEQLHDDNGNLSSDAQRQYHFDAMNRLVRVTTLGGNTVATYKYDAFGRRIEKRAGSDTLRYVHFGKQVLEERNVFNLLQRQYVYGRTVDDVLQMRNAANQDFYYHDNAIGSVSAISDASGAVVERYRYNAYGVTTILSADGLTSIATSTIENPYGFTGRRFDSETGFYYYRARYYAPERGRFIQRDPLGYSDGMGVYAYVGNNPVNFVDPSGMVKEFLTELIPGKGIYDAYGSYKEGEYLASLAYLASEIPAAKALKGGKAAWQAYQKWRKAQKAAKSKKALDAAKAGKNARKGGQGDVSTGAGKASDKAPDFVVSPGGTAFPVPKGATGPTPVVNPGGKTTGSAFTGGKGGANGKVDTMRIMNPTPSRGKSPGYPNGNIKYENKFGQGVDPYTGRTLSNKDSHFPID